MEKHRIRIIAMICNWCTYAAADLAGVLRLPYPECVKIVRLMCTGMVDSKYIIKSFLDGADGVFIGGCHFGDCHYIDGNIKAKKKISGISVLLECFGITSERLIFFSIGASEGHEFQKNLISFVQKIEKINF